MAIVDDPGQYFSSRILRLQVPYQEGRDVRILQSLLNLMPENVVRTRLDTDGIFGLDTRSAVSDFQKYFRLYSGGVVTDETFYCLGQCRGKFSRGEPVFSSRIIGNSSRGRDVQVLQNRLAAFGKTFLNRPASGKYDLYTAQAVDYIQNDLSIHGERGAAGPQTYDAILLLSPLGGRVLKKGRHGLDTYFLQLYLYQLGYYNFDPDGFFGSSTFKALKIFQHAADIRSDGIAGPQTFLALGNSLPFPVPTFCYRTQSGDTVSSISSLFEQEIAYDIRGLKTNPKPVKPGKFLKIPVPLAFHVLKRRDSIDTVAERYGIRAENLFKANRLQVSMGLVPGTALVLPGYQVNLTGSIVYLNRREHGIELRSIDLEDMSSRVLHFYYEHEIKQFGKNENKSELGRAAITNCNGRINPDSKRMESCSKSLRFDCQDHLVKARLDTQKIIDADKFFPSGLPNRPLLPYEVTCAFDLHNVKKFFPGQHINQCQLSPDGSYMIIFASIPPARESAAYLFNFKHRLLLKISDDAINCVISRDGRQFLLTSRRYFGAYYPWFYCSINRFTSRGHFLNEEILGRSAEINAECFNPDNTAMVLVMGTPNKFYPLPDRSRHLYIKKLNSSLLLQITSEDKPFFPVWI